MPRADGHVDLVLQTPNGNTRIGAVISQDLFVETQALDFGAPEALKQIHTILLEVTEYGNLSGLGVQIGTKERLQDPVAWGLVYSASEANKPIFVRPTESRYFVFRLLDSNVQAIWKISGMQVLGRVIGGRT